MSIPFPNPAAADGRDPPVDPAALAATNETIKHLRHDLRTPLNQMIGYAEMLIESVTEDGPPELLDDLQRLLGSAGELLMLLNDALAQWKIEAGCVDLVALRRNFAGPLNAFVGYRDLCQDVARTKGRMDLVADLGKIEAATQNLRRLMDTEAFTTRVGSTPPVAAPSPAVVVPTASSASPHPPATATPAAWGRVLVVDDEPLNREMLLRRLARMGYQTVGAENGERALELMAHESFDLVLLDIMMPVLDGFATLDRLKADPKLRHIPVVMLTALDEVASTVRCIEAGAEDYVPKPFNPVILRARMGASLEKKRLRDQERAYLAEIQSQRAKSERLLLNVLPKAIGDRLKSGEQTIVDAVPEATILFADIVGFTHIAAASPPARMVSLLNEIFSEFDHLSEAAGIEKIKTIGDAYMAVGGVPLPVPDHAVRCARLALDMIAAVHRFNTRHQFQWQLRIGIHTGPVVAGIIGSTKFAYDLWGDTVNIASRLESHGEPDVPQVSDYTAKLIQPHFELEPRGHIELKNRGQMQVFRLLRRR